MPSFAAQLAAIAAGRTEARLRVGNLSARRDFVNVDDAAAAGLLLLTRGEPGEIYNVASGTAWSIEALLGRLFHEDMATHGVRVYDPLPVVYHCPQDWTKVRDMIRSLGREDAETILREHGELLIRDDICNHSYRFSADDIAELFAGAGPTLH